MRIRTVDISPEVEDVLRRGEWKGWLFVLPAGQLERPLYLAVNKVLEAIGGKWSKRERGHMFSLDGRKELEAALDHGHVVDQKKTLEQFFTPADLARRMVAALDIKRGDRVLEPSAGIGRLVLPALERGATVTAVELDDNLARAMIETYKAVTQRGVLIVVVGDFMVQPGCDYDKVLMNPPFSGNQDIRHVRRAFEMLKPGGELAAIMAPHFTFAEDQESREFRALIGFPDRFRLGDQTGVELSGSQLVREATVEMLPAGAFKAEGTNIAAVLVMIEKER